jgi:hypothetical protein
MQHEHTGHRTDVRPTLRPTISCVEEMEAGVLRSAHTRASESNEPTLIQSTPVSASWAQQPRVCMCVEVQMRVYVCVCVCAGGWVRRGDRRTMVTRFGSVCAQSSQLFL